jgi:hypothetical protein
VKSVLVKSQLLHAPPPHPPQPSPDWVVCSDGSVFAPASLKRLYSGVNEAGATSCVSAPFAENPHFGILQLGLVPWEYYSKIISLVQ